MDKKNILIIEDERITAEDITLRLRNLGYQVPASVSTGEEAIAAAERYAPDLILMDIELQGEVNGIEAADSIRRTSRTPVVFITAYADSDTIEKVKITEPYGFIVKPFDDSELKGVIETALYKHQMEAELREKQAWLSTILTSIGDGVIATDKDGRITLMNPVAERLTGRLLPDCLHTPAARVFRLLQDDDESVPFPDPVDTILSSGVSPDFPADLVLVSSHETRIPVDVNGAPIFDSRNNLIGAVLNFRDVTEQRKYKDNVSHVHTIINRSPAVVITWKNTRGWPVTWVSENVKVLLGFRAEELTDKPFAYRDFIHPDDRERVTREVKRFITDSADDSFTHQPYRLITRRQEVKWVQDTTRIHRDHSGNIRHFEGILLDITDKIKITQELQRSKQDWEEIFQAVGHPAMILDPGHTVLAVNRAICSITGLKEQELVGRKCHEIFHTSDGPPPGCPFKKAQVSGHLQTVHMEMEAVGKKFNVSCTPVYDDTGELKKVIHIATDITALKTAEKALSDSERLYRLLFETASEGVLVAETASKKLRLANPAICRMLGYTERELLSMDARGIHPPETHEHVFAEFHAQAEGRKQTVYSIPLLRKDGSIRYANISSSPLVMDGTACNLGFFTDITDTLASNRALQESEERYRKLFDSSHDAIFTMSGDTFIDCNSRTLEIFRCSREQIINQAPYLFSPPVQPDGSESREKALQYIKKAGKGEPQCFEWRHRRSDGTDFDAEVNLIRVDISSETIIFATVRDISDRNKAESALKESQQKFKEMADLLPQVIFETDIDGRLTYTNKQGFKVFGYTEADMRRGIKVTDLIVPEERERAAENFFKSLSEHFSKDYEYTVSRKDGSRFPVSIYANPVIRHGRPAGLRGLLVDISAEHKARESLKQSETFYRQVIENASGIPFRLIFGKSVGEGHYDIIGSEIEHMLGIKADTFTEARFNRIIQSTQPTLPGIPADPEKTRQMMIQGKIASYKADLLVETPDGTAKWLSDSSLPLKDEKSGKIIGAFGVLQDITRRKLAEEALKQSEEQYRTLIDQSNDAIYLLYQDRFLIVNKRFTEMFGYTLEEMNKPDFHFSHLIHPDSTAIIEERKTRAAAGKPLDSVYEFTAINKTGKKVECETSVTYLHYSGGIATQGIIRNITERKRADEKIRSSLKEKEVLLKEIHHRVKNNLQIIASLLNLQSRQITDPAMKDIFNDVKHRVHTMALIHEGLYRSGNFAKINFSEYIGSLIRHLSQAYKTENTAAITLNIETISLEIEQAIPCGLIVNELLTNSLKHAFKETNKDRKISVSFKKKGTFLELSVSDNGIGLPDHLNIDDSESLGLKMVHILAYDQLEGTLKVSRKKGTNIKILFKQHTT